MGVSHITVLLRTEAELNRCDPGHARERQLGPFSVGASIVVVTNGGPQLDERGRSRVCSGRIEDGVVLRGSAAVAPSAEDIDRGEIARRRERVCKAVIITDLYLAGATAAGRGHEAVGAVGELGPCSGRRHAGAIRWNGLSAAPRVSVVEGAARRLIAGLGTSLKPEAEKPVLPTEKFCVLGVPPVYDFADANVANPKHATPSTANSEPIRRNACQRRVAARREGDGQTTPASMRPGRHLGHGTVGTGTAMHQHAPHGKFTESTAHHRTS